MNILNYALAPRLGDIVCLYFIKPRILFSFLLLFEIGSEKTLRSLYDVSEDHEEASSIELYSCPIASKIQHLFCNLLILLRHRHRSYPLLRRPMRLSQCHFLMPVFGQDGGRQIVPANWGRNSPCALEMDFAI